MASNDDLPLSEDCSGTKLGLTITRGAPGQKKDFKGSNRKVKTGRILKRPFRDATTIILTVDDDDDGRIKRVSYETPKNGNNIHGRFCIPKYEQWHKSSKQPNPYHHYFFPVMENEHLGLTLGVCESWDLVSSSAQTVLYHTEHVFEIQQLKYFLCDLIEIGWQSGNDDMQDILFDPNCNPIQSWPFQGSERTSVAQLLADCLPNHTSGLLKHDFVYLEASINKMKGGYFYNQIPKALTGSADELPTGLTQLEETWTALRTTILVLKYLNNDLVVSKYNHVSQRMRRMLEEIARQSREDRLTSQHWHLWSSWEPLAASEKLMRHFNAFETTFLQEVEIRIQTAIQKGLYRIANLQPTNSQERDFHDRYKQLLKSQPSFATPHAFGLSLHKLSQTKAQREDWTPHSELEAHVSQTELGDVEDMEIIDTQDVNDDPVRKGHRTETSSRDWAAEFTGSWRRSEDHYKYGFPSADPMDSDKEF